MKPTEPKNESLDDHVGEHATALPTPKSTETERKERLNIVPIPENDELVFRVPEPLKLAAPYELLSGYLRPGLITIGGEASTGKTMLGTELLRHIVMNNQNYFGVAMSLDDSPNFLFRKMYWASKGERQTPTDDDLRLLRASFRSGKDEAIHEAGSRTRGLSWMPKVAIHEFRECGDILDAVRYFLEDNPGKKIVLLIDYLQKIRSHSESIRERFNDIVDDLKDFTKSNEGMVTLLLSQLRRRQGKDDEAWYTYRETSEIENVSDLCVNIERVRGGGDHERRIKIVKNKHGDIDAEGFLARITEAYGFAALEPWSAPLQGAGQGHSNPDTHPDGRVRID